MCPQLRSFSSDEDRVQSRYHYKGPTCRLTYKASHICTCIYIYIYIGSQQRDAAHRARMRPQRRIAPITHSAGWNVTLHARHCYCEATRQRLNIQSSLSFQRHISTSCACNVDDYCAWGSVLRACFSGGERWGGRQGGREGGGWGWGGRGYSDHYYYHYYIRRL